MAVKRRATSAGQSRFWSYRFRMGGERFHGICRNSDGAKCTSQRQAEAAEKRQRALAAELMQQKSVAALVQNFKQRLAGGNRMLLGDAWAAYVKKPRRRAMGERHGAMVANRWHDFLLFLRDRHPTVECLHEATPHMAEVYIRHIETHGAYTDTVLRDTAKKLDIPVPTLKRYRSLPDFPAAGTIREIRAWIRKRSIGMRKKHLRKRRGFTEPARRPLSPQSRNNYLQTCRTVFATLAEEGGVVDNPFDGIARAKPTPEAREAFTEAELRLIGEKASGWIYALFLGAIYTGLREGDVCTLRWREVDLDSGWIRRRMRKTGKIVDIPILAPLTEHLQRLPHDGEYVFPKLAERYLEKRATIGWHVSRFLQGLGIETTRKVDAGARAISVKDIHSCRHTFVYLAAQANVPLPVVQGVVGHLDTDMTKRYMDHATRRDKQIALARIPDLLNGHGVERSAKQRARELIDAADESTVAVWLQIMAAEQSTPPR